MERFTLVLSRSETHFRKKTLNFKIAIACERRKLSRYLLGELDDEHVTASMRAKLQDKQRKASFKAYRRLTNGTSNEIDVFFKYFGNFFCFMLFCVFKTVICNANISRKR